MTQKLNLGVFLGGRSCEHEVSVTSARSLLDAVDREKYNIYLIGIDKQGLWHLSDSIESLISGKEVTALPSTSKDNVITMGLHHEGNLEPVTPAQASAGLPALDVVFPVLHGTFGEDGTIQGVFEMAGIPYVGCGVAASSIAMDKALAKQVFYAAGIPQAPCNIVSRFAWNSDQTKITNQAEQTLGYPAFVKPANMGSSVGVSKANNQTDLIKAIAEAFEYDNKVIIEQSMENCHEVECAVLGNEDPQASLVGEILPGAEFYDYQTKYIDDKTETLIPATISEASAQKVRQLSVDAFRAIDGSGLSRVDFFVHRETGEVYLNEINTLPGFTPISMYPKMWAATGVPYSELIDRLIELALARQVSRAGLKRAF